MDEESRDPEASATKRQVRRTRPRGHSRVRLPKRFGKPPGAKPGIELDELDAEPGADLHVPILCIDYGPDRSETREISDLDAFIASHRPEWTAVRWINVDGIHNRRVIQALARKYELHPLAIEDLLHVPQRPKVDAYHTGSNVPNARLFVICQMLRLKDDSLDTEQVSIFLGHNTVLTFQQDPGDAWDAIRQRIATKGSRLRQNDASFLVYSLLDAIVDHAFPLLEHYGEALEALEERVLESPESDVAHGIHRVKRQLLLLRRVAWPMRDVVSALQREEHECMSASTRTYLRDVYDHVVQIIDILETYRELATGLEETYLTAASNRLNGIMKVLTIIGTIFLPLTFLAGVYGMNFRHMPEIEVGWAYPWVYPIGFWTVSATIAAALWVWFRRRDWI